MTQAYCPGPGRHRKHVPVIRAPFYIRQVIDISYEDAGVRDRLRRRNVLEEVNGSGKICNKSILALK